MKKIDHKIINDMYKHEIGFLEHKIKKYGHRTPRYDYWGRVIGYGSKKENESDKSYKRELKRKLKQTKQSYERFKKEA